MDSPHNRQLSPGTAIGYSGIVPTPVAQRRRGDPANHLGKNRLRRKPGNGFRRRLGLADQHCGGGTTGHFSLFEGMNRILTVIDGGDLAISIDGGATAA